MIALLLIVAVAAVPTTMSRVQAEPDCEQVGVHDNPAGNAAGNGQQCISDEHIKNEPVRDCSHKNSEKDNNENDFGACIPRGASGGDDE